MQREDIPAGFCQCGCGQRTTVPTRSNASKGWVRGEPLRFLRGHHGRQRLLNDWSAFYDEVAGPLDSACWVWNGTLDPKGYADRMALLGRRVEAHRAFYERQRGQIPPGLELDHLCRNRACVNPEHLEPVTHTENMRRGAVSKLDVDKVREIKRLDRDGLSLDQIAVRFGVGQDCIRSIVRRHRSWRGV